VVCGLLVLGACVWATPARADTVYSAAADFSPTNNPTGVWSYGWSATLGSALNLYPTPGSTSGIDYWIDPPITMLGVPSVTHNSTANVVTLGTVTWQPGQMVFHPGHDGQYSVVRWTAPVEGDITLHAYFPGADFVGPTTTDVHVLYNGFALFDGDVSQFGSGPSYDTALTVAAGDILDFAVGIGSDGSFLYDSTGLDAIITYPDGGGGSGQANPEPSTLLLLGLGGLGLLSYGWCRRRARSADVPAEPTDEADRRPRSRFRGRRSAQAAGSLS
jgi:hypothetical protein